MGSNKIIAVVGATGAQGGGLVRAILSDPDNSFQVRAITRNAQSEKAKELASLGAQVVEADVDDKGSLIKAFEGTYGAFCVTFFWEHFSPEKEKGHAKNMAEAAKEAGVKHVIWSSLEDTRKWVPLDSDRMPTLMGEYKVPHFDAKGEANSYFEDSGTPYTILNTSFYWDNFIYFGMGPRKTEDGSYTLTMPLEDKRFPGIAAQDIGKCALGIFQAGEIFQGKTVGISGEQLTGEEMAKGFSELLGTRVNYYAVPAPVYRTFGFPGAEDLGNMFQFNTDFAEYFCSSRDTYVSRLLNPGLLSYTEWLQQNREKIIEITA